VVGNVILLRLIPFMRLNFSLILMFYVNFRGKETGGQHEEDPGKINNKLAFTQIIRYKPKVIDIKKGYDQGPAHEITKITGEPDLRLGDQGRQKIKQYPPRNMEGDPVNDLPEIHEFIINQPVKLANGTMRRIETRKY
jgi:hypothetical protein